MRADTRRVWCVAPGCRWASYRTAVVRREPGAMTPLEVPREATAAELERGACPRCLQDSLRTYPPTRQPGDVPLPGMPEHRDDRLQHVDGKALQQQRRLEKAAAR